MSRNSNLVGTYPCLLRQIDLEGMQSPDTIKEFSVPILLRAEQDCRIRAFSMHFEAKNLISNLVYPKPNSNSDDVITIFPLPYTMNLRGNEYIRAIFKLSLVEIDKVSIECEVFIEIKTPIRDEFHYRFCNWTEEPKII